MLLTGRYDAEAMEGAGGARWQQELLEVTRGEGPGIIILDDTGATDFFGHDDLSTAAMIHPLTTTTSGTAEEGRHGEEETYGISSCVFESTRPFHPIR